MMQYFRTIILQDAVCLKKDFPDHPIFKHPIFSSEDFAAFENELNHAMDNFGDHKHIDFERFNKPMFRFVDNEFLKVHSHLTKEMQSLKRHFEGQYSELFEMNSLIFKRARTAMNSLFAPLPSSASSTVESLSTAESLLVASWSESPIAAASSASSIPSFPLDKTLLTIRQAYDEFLNVIIPMNRQHGTKWRNFSPSIKIYYSRRMKIINKILSLVENGHSLNGAINKMEIKRGNKSLLWLSKNIDKLDLWYGCSTHYIDKLDL